VQVAAVRLTSAGNFGLVRGSTNVGTTAPATLGATHTIELGVRVNASGAADDFAFRVDGTLIYSESTSSTDSTIDGCRMGAVTSPGVNSTTVDIDNIAVNDDTGGSDNSWPGVPDSASAGHRFFLAL
jgi:hypothetical protein